MARSRWTHERPRTREVNWQSWQQNKNAQRAKAKNENVALVYVLVHNPHRDSYTGRVEPQSFTMMGPLFEVRETLVSTYGGSRWVGQPTKVCDIFDTPVYVVHVMRPLDKATMADMGWDRVDGYIVSTLAHDPEAEWPLTFEQMVDDVCKELGAYAFA